jgi:hypothetical protein
MENKENEAVPWSESRGRFRGCLGAALDANASTGDL